MNIGREGERRTRTVGNEREAASLSLARLSVQCCREEEGGKGREEVKHSSLARSPESSITRARESDGA